MISSNDTSSGTSEYLKSKSTLGVISKALHNSSNVSAETKLLPNSIWLKLLAERFIFSASASWVKVRLILSHEYGYLNFF